MYPPHAHDDVDDDSDELPELPIPRPGEERAHAPASAAPIAPPTLGGGASFTAVDPNAPAAPPAIDRSITERAQREALEATRFNWELAARLTQGMLANPARPNVSVKDAMGIFDQFLTEMQSYARISRGDEHGPQQQADVTRRAEHGEYFQQAAKAAGPQPTRILEPRPDPAITPAITHAPDAAMLPKQQPLQPRPPESYQSLPPRARYVPGSMAGPSPDTMPDGADQPRGDERAA